MGRPAAVGTPPTEPMDKEDDDNPSSLFAFAGIKHCHLQNADEGTKQTLENLVEKYTRKYSTEK